MAWNKFAYVNLVCALLAAVLWYVFPQLMAWPLLLGVVPWLLRLAHEGKWRWQTPFDLPLLFFLVSGLIAVWSAYNRDLAWAKFWTIAAGVILFYALAAFSLPGAPDEPKQGGAKTAWFMTFLGAAVSLYFISTHEWGAFPTKFDILSRVGQTVQAPLPALPGHRLHPNVVGGILAMMLPFSTAVTVLEGKARNRAAFVFGLVLMAVTLLGLMLSESRGAWLAVMAALTLAVLWWLTGLTSSRRPGRRRLLFIGTLVLGVILAFILVLIWPGITRQPWESITLLVGGQDRLRLFQNSLILIQEYPFIGAGLNSYMMLHATYSILTHVGFIIHAHNIYLDVWIEQGLVGLIALLWVWGVFAVAFWRESFRGNIRPYFGAAALSLVTILLHGVVEDALYGSRSLMLLFLPSAFAIPYPKREEAAAPLKRGLALGAILGLLIVGAILWARPLGSAALSNLASIRQSQSELGRYSWPEWPIQDAVRREVNLSQSIVGFEKALSIDPSNAAANRRLGQIELSLGEYEDALEHLERAYANTPWDYASQQLLGEALLTNDRVDEGAALWADLSNSQNQLQARIFWYEYIADEERLKNIVTGADN